MADFFTSIAESLNGLTGLQMSIHGYVALLLTLIGVMGLCIGYIYLLRLSHSSGHDDAVHEYRDPRSQNDDDDGKNSRGGSS